MQLQQQHTLRWQDIARIDLTGGATQRMLAEPAERKQAPATAIDARFSLPFTVAAALVHGRIGLDSFTPAALQHDDVRGLAARVRFHATKPMPSMASR